MFLERVLVKSHNGTSTPARKGSVFLFATRCRNVFSNAKKLLKAPYPRRILTIELERLGEYNQHPHSGFSHLIICILATNEASQPTLRRASGI